MLVAIILGNRLNDDGSMTQMLRSRLETALTIERLFSPDKIIVSGGVANPVAGTSEAHVMCEYLVANGVAREKIVKEDKSLTTKQNAEFSVPMAVCLGATEILLSTSTEHMSRRYLNPMRLFAKQLKRHSEIKLSVFSQTVFDCER